MVEWFVITAWNRIVVMSLSLRNTALDRCNDVQVA